MEHANAADVAAEFRFGLHGHLVGLTKTEKSLTTPPRKVCSAMVTSLMGTPSFWLSHDPVRVEWPEYPDYPRNLTNFRALLGLGDKVVGHPCQF